MTISIVLSLSRLHTLTLTQSLSCRPTVHSFMLFLQGPALKPTAEWLCLSKLCEHANITLIYHCSKFHSKCMKFQIRLSLSAFWAFPGDFGAYLATTQAEGY